MQKFFLSVFVIITFILYAWTVRVKGDAQNPIIIPKTISKRITVVPSTTVALVSPTPTVTPTKGFAQPTKIIQQPTATPQPILPTATPRPQGQYKDGTYTGSVADAFYGPLQVQVTISGGRISNIQFLQAPNDRDTSIMINQQADPLLAQEALQAQSANVDIISGATDSSQAFVESMQQALAQAKS